MQISGMDLKVYSFPVIDSKMYVLVTDRNALVIDPHVNEQALKYLEDNNIKDIKVILTHEHYDHISGVNYIRKYAGDNSVKCTVIAGARCTDALPYPKSNLSKYFDVLFLNKTDEEQQLAAETFDHDYRCLADISVNDGDELMWGYLNLVFRETPGHSPGSICIEMRDDKDDIVALATGDSLVQGNNVITRLPGGSKRDYAERTRPYLESISPDTLILPGHGNISLMKDLELG
ncbi:MBL fold metallo-hydrolase [Butyrivibrio sp. XPD2006]|uniref:MBL fold metallo-hydrolase n=1 Tax=Butyrivibrio sp. XPD2006 TaxID=1280668 RepID=UPI0003B3573F|nr:MBL fold metallo-hydrolase [Butyrivibrio sp. XPD2006]